MSGKTRKTGRKEKKEKKGMKIIKQADYNRNEQKGSELDRGTGNYETKLYFGLGNRIFSDWNLQRTDQKM